MKIICLVSRGLGHLDFGGKGYLTIVDNLKQRGHEIVFYTSNHYKLLNSLGYKYIKSEDVDLLWLWKENVNINRLDRSYFMKLKYIELTIRNEQPDLVLVDRILGLASGLLNSLKIKYVAVGTPGGKWSKDVYSILPKTSVHNTNGVLDLYKKKLDWDFNVISVWCNSPYLNLVFIGKEFYNGISSSNTLYINNFDFKKSKGEGRVGISLGSGMDGNFDEMINIFKEICDLSSADEKIFLYGKSNSISKFISLLPNDYLNRIDTKGYVDFNEELKNLTYLVFYGGIGTLWYCLNNNVIPIIVSSKIHDQDYNANQCKLLKINGQVGEMRNDFDPNSNFTFNATIESAVNKIEELVD